MISAMKIRLPRTLNPCSNPTPTNPLRPLSIVGILKRSAQGYMFFCFLIYSELKNKMIETLKCESGDMEAAQWIPCPGEKDASWFPSGVLFVLSITVIIIFTAGLLVIASILLFLRQNRLSTPGTKALIGFLYLPYRPQMFWWEIPSFVRRLIILCMINFLPLHSVSYGLCIGAFFFILMIIQQWLKPFHDSLANWMELFGLCCCSSFPTSTLSCLISSFKRSHRPITSACSSLRLTSSLPSASWQLCCCQRGSLFVGSWLASATDGNRDQISGSTLAQRFSIRF